MGDCWSTWRLLAADQWGVPAPSPAGLRRHRRLAVATAAVSAVLCAAGVVAATGSGAGGGPRSGHGPVGVGTTATGPRRTLAHGASSDATAAVGSATHVRHDATSTSVAAVATSLVSATETRRSSNAIARSSDTSSGASATTATAAPLLTAGQPGYDQVVSEAQFIESAQLPNGAIETYPNSSLVSPYIGDYAAMGLARATQLTGDPSYLAAAWRWIAWYQGAEGPGGVVDDANVVDGTTTSTGSVDSTDATSGTFLMAVLAAVEASGNTTELQAHAGAIGDAVGVIASTTNAQGLTWALASYQAAYLMDESEVYGGLRAAIVLADLLGDDTLASEATTMAQRLDQAVATLWNPSLEAYDWAAFPDGFTQPTNWAVLYPDDLEQMWAVAFGLALSSTATTLSSEFLARQPLWDQPSAQALQNVKGHDVDQTVEFWPVVVWALVADGQSQAAAAGEAAIQADAAAHDDDWPYTPGIAGQLIVGESLLLGQPAL
jgi:hypothetical protein